MIIDDSKMDTWVLKQMLTSSECKPSIITFEYPLEAVSYLKAAHQEKDFDKLPTLIFLDINMPGINGFEVLAELEELNQDIKVVMVSSSDDPQDIAKTSDYEFVKGYIVKPVRFEDLMNIQTSLNM